MDVVLDAVGDEMQPFLDALDTLLRSGKRLRPAFAYWGWRCAGGDDCAEIVRAVAALELLQACALIHDDVMDDSDTRRGGPSKPQGFGRQRDLTHAGTAGAGTRIPKL